MRDMDVELLEAITSIIPEQESSDDNRTVKKTKGGKKK